MKTYIYLNTGIASLIALLLLIVMFNTWPLTEYSLNDIILGTVQLTPTEKVNIIDAIGLNYAIDTIFIFCWIASWLGLFLYFKSINTPFVKICLVLSIIGALLDITENSIIFTLLIGNYKNVETPLLIHSIIRDISYWLPMVASFLLAIIIPFQNRISNTLIKITGTFGVLLAVLGMFVRSLSFIPNYWFVLWFIVATFFLFTIYKSEKSIKS